jgi:hypothetical protein
VAIASLGGKQPADHPVLMRKLKEVVRDLSAAVRAYVVRVVLRRREAVLRLGRALGGSTASM